jgi:methionine biosynthesis protein MetW
VEAVFKDALRVGKKVIVGFPNFAFYKARLQFCFQGKAPVTGGLPYQWYETPNLHFLSISDFIDYCHTHKITIERSIFINEGKCISFLPNLFAQIGIFVVSA